MALEFDPEKDVRNITAHEISLSRSLDLEILAVIASVKNDELRHRAYGHIDHVPHCLVFTYRGDNIRAISLRRVHAREMRRYVPPKD